MKLRRYTVIVSERAAEMLTAHAKFLARVSEPAAQKLTAEFEVKARTLEALPERCSWLSWPLLPERKYRKLLFEKRYLLIFQIKKRTVFIDAVLDCRQDYRWLL